MISKTENFKRPSCSFLAILSFLLLVCLPAGVLSAQSQQDVTVSGIVTDASSGETLPGVNISVKGTTSGTSTNTNGQYELTVGSLQDTLVFSFVGFQRQEVPLNGRSSVDIDMQTQTITGEELVVVGYGEQEKQDVSSSVDQISSADISGRPIDNLNKGLQGISPNVNVTPQSGKPFESPTINIRGITSIGQGGNALILIDGVEGDPSMVNPKDIASISVLKDAAAAAEYGARGAFGVIQITTKDGPETGFSVEVGTDVGFKQPAIATDFVSDGYTYAKNFNDAYRNALGTTPKNINKTQPFSEEYLDELERRHNDPSLPKVEVNDAGQYIYYSSTDWYDKLYKDQLLSQSYNMSVSGASEQANFLISGQYQGQEGLFRYNSDDYDKYNIRAKGSVDLFRWLEASNNFSFAKRSYFNPLNVGEGGGIWRNIADEGHPTAPMLNPDGSITHSGAYTVGDFYYGKNGKDYGRQIVSNKTELEATFLDDRLSLTGNFTIENTLNNITEKRVPVPYSVSPDETILLGIDQNNLAETNNDADYYASNLFAEYQDTFLGKHNIDFTVSGNYEKSVFDGVYLQRNGLAFPDADNINLTLGQGINTSGTYDAWEIFGVFYSADYNYDDRYLLTLNGRYDGSSKFPSDQRFGFFPSVSAGWRIAEESFWKLPENLISELKISASYGSLGNGNVDPYTFQQTLGIYQMDRIIDGAQPQAITNPGVLPGGLTWETVTTSNIGIDMAMLSGRLEFSGDAYIRETTDMFTAALTPPRVFGAATPRGNYADLRTRGWGAQLSWNDNFELGGRNMNYKIGVNISDSRAEITKFNNPDKNLNDYYEGMAIGEIWGFKHDGFFESQEEINNHADQSSYFNPNSTDGQFRAGDSKYKDLNNDGVVNNGNNTVAEPGDQRVIGNSQARYRFGININVNWANFSLSSFFQGVGKRDWYPSSEASGFWGQYNRPYNNIPRWHLEDGVVWSEDNPDAFLPRYTGYKVLGRTLSNPQTKYVMNAAYIRLKNIQLGYNLTSRYLSDLGIKSGRVYINGTNLWTYTPLHQTADNLDPENAVAGSDNDISGGGAGQGLNYPILQSVSLGVSLNF